MMTIFYQIKTNYRTVYLLDTNIVSEFRKKSKINSGVQGFLLQTVKENQQLYLSVITIGELRRGVELIRHRGDRDQAALLETWLEEVITKYRNHLLSFTEHEAQLWGHLRVPHHQNSHDKQIAATALTHDLCVVTRNISHFKDTGVRLLNPFTGIE